MQNLRADLCRAATRFPVERRARFLSLCVNSFFLLCNRTIYFLTRRVQAGLPLLHRYGVLLLHQTITFGARATKRLLVVSQLLFDAIQDVMRFTRTPARALLAFFKNAIDRLKQRGVQDKHHHQNDRDMKNQRAVRHELDGVFGEGQSNHSTRQAHNELIELPNCFVIEIFRTSKSLRV